MTSKFQTNSKLMQPMRMVILLIALAYSYAPGRAQQALNVENFDWYCSFDGSSLPGELYGFTSDRAAASALEQVVRYTGLNQNFLIQAANVDNAVAVVDGTNRLILYNQDFMLRIANVERDWAALSILAHEVGHHLQGHTLLPGGSRPPIELEADQYSGFVLERMGASLDQAQAAMKNLAPEYGSDTHPGRGARLAAITNGWVSSCELSTQRAGVDSGRCVPPPPAEDPRPEPPTTSSRQLDYSMDPYFGETSLVAGFTPDPFTIDVTSGGSVNAQYLGGECRGYAAQAPDFRLRWSGQSSLLRIYFDASGISGDTTLIVNAPNGSWMCNDDRPAGGLNPELSISGPIEGVFDIWIGSYNEEENVAGVLSISELRN